MGRLTKSYVDKSGYTICERTSTSVKVQELVDKLAHYEDLEEQGRLIELPCAVGDTVWFVGQQLNHYFITEYAFDIFMFDDIGNRIFLTKEEAEAKLKELEEHHFTDADKMGKE